MWFYFALIGVLAIQLVTADDCSDIDCGSATNSATCVSVCAATEGCEWDSSGYAYGVSCTSTDALYSSECCVGEPTSAPTEEPTPAPVTESPTAAPTCPTEEECSEYDSAECCAADSDCYYDYDGYDIWDVPCSSEDAMAGTCCVQLTTAEPTENPTDFPTDLPSAEPTESPTTSQPTSAEPTASPTCPEYDSCEEYSNSECCTADTACAWADEDSLGVSCDSPDAREGECCYTTSSPTVSPTTSIPTPVPTEMETTTAETTEAETTEVETTAAETTEAETTEAETTEAATTEAETTEAETTEAATTEAETTEAETTEAATTEAETTEAETTEAATTEAATTEAETTEAETTEAATTTETATTESETSTTAEEESVTPAPTPKTKSKKKKKKKSWPTPKPTLPSAEKWEMIHPAYKGNDGELLWHVYYGDFSDDERFDSFRKAEQWDALQIRSVLHSDAKFAKYRHNNQQLNAQTSLVTDGSSTSWYNTKLGQAGIICVAILLVIGFMVWYKYWSGSKKQTEYSPLLIKEAANPFYYGEYQEVQ